MKDWERFEPLVQAISRKYVRDSAIREDACQEARLHLWRAPEGMPDGYYRNLIRNKCVGLSTGPNTGAWSGKLYRGKQLEYRYVPLDLLTGLIQIDERGRVWCLNRAIWHAVLGKFYEETLQEEEFSDAYPLRLIRG
jgi:hypothetical protein